MKTKPEPPTRSTTTLVCAAALDEVQRAGCKVVHVEGQTIALFFNDGNVYAIDNRCPHMGFPLDRGTIKECILTCHWHHARFDLTSGGTFDPWADDVRVYPVEVRDGEVWVDVTQRINRLNHHRTRITDGLERNIPLVIAKGIIFLIDVGNDPAGAFRIGLEFGTRGRWEGWGQGLTILTCMMNLLPHLEPGERPRALYHGLSAVALECEGQAPRFGLRPLPDSTADLGTLKRWFRQFVEVRDADGAERCILSALRGGANDHQMADMLFAAATDHHYIQIGHVLDFTNKAFEALDAAGWDHAESVLASLAHGFATADRMEESNAWRHPVDLIAILDNAFEQLQSAIQEGHSRRGTWTGRDMLIPGVLSDDPDAIAVAMLDALRAGATFDELAGAVTYAAALRIARFHTSNEFSDWDTALHTFSFANAVHQGLRRAPSVELLRGVFDASMSVYLDRFLNVPAARLPSPSEDAGNIDDLMGELRGLLDRQQQVTEAAELVARYANAGGASERLLAQLGSLLLREDRDFHTIQTVEAAFRQYEILRGTPEATHVAIAAVRYLAAHSPTVRAQEQTFRIAQRLHRGETLFEEG